MSLQLLAVLASALLTLRLASVSGVSAQNASTLFVPAETTACLDAIPGPCVLIQQPELINNTCARANIAQIAADISSTDEAQGVDLVFYGDSILKLFKDGKPKTNGRSDVFINYFGGFSAAVLGASGDQAANLLWRLQNGALFTHHQPKVAVVLIGTNDLGAVACQRSDITAAARGVVARIQDIVQYLQQKNPTTQLILMGILPRADGEALDAGVYQWPNKFTEGVAAVNSGLDACAGPQSNVHYLDCTDTLFPDGKVTQALLPDGLHPSAEGLGRLAQCLSPVIINFT